MFLGKSVIAVNCRFMLFQETETQETAVVPRITKPCNWCATAAARAKVEIPGRPGTRLLKSDWSTSHTPRYQHWPIRLNFHPLFKVSKERQEESVRSIFGVWTLSHSLPFSRRKRPWRQKQIRPYLLRRGLLPRPSLKSQLFTKSKSLFHFSVQIDTSYYHNHKDLLILVFPTQAVFYEPYRCHGITMHSETHGYKAISKKTECCHWVSRTLLNSQCWSCLASSSPWNSNYREIPKYLLMCSVTYSLIVLLSAETRDLRMSILTTLPQSWPTRRMSERPPWLLKLFPLRLKLRQ